ncbi:membrane protein [Achromatium sp. WMS1]|nr:membrane protein [Achromatium sp. WMS1]
MSGNYFTNPLIFLIQTILGTFGLLVLLRFLFQLVQADFYNPVSQFLVTVTGPALRPLRRVIPGTSGLDLASLVLAWLVKALELFLVILLSGWGIRLGVLAWAIPEIIEMLINIFLVAIIIQVVLSWIAPGSGFNPVLSLIYDLAELVLEPARSLIPPFEGIDFSPLVASVGLVLLKMLLLPPIKYLTGSPF